MDLVNHLPGLGNRYFTQKTQQDLITELTKVSQLLNSLLSLTAIDDLTRDLTASLEITGATTQICSRKATHCARGQ